MNNRDILFRAKDRFGSWHTGSLVKGDQYNRNVFHILTHGKDGSNFEVIPETICQYVGMNVIPFDDATGEPEKTEGQKLFENDILSIHGTLKAVRWVNSGFMLVLLADYSENRIIRVGDELVALTDRMWSFDRQDLTFAKIVGNLIDNEEADNPMGEVINIEKMPNIKDFKRGKDETFWLTDVQDETPEQIVLGGACLKLPDVFVVIDYRKKDKMAYIRTDTPSHTKKILKLFTELYGGDAYLGGYPLDW